METDLTQRNNEVREEDKKQPDWATASKAPQMKSQFPEKDHKT